MCVVCWCVFAWGDLVGWVWVRLSEKEIGRWWSIRLELRARAGLRSLAQGTILITAKG